MNAADSASDKWSPMPLAWPVLLKQNKSLYFTALKLHSWANIHVNFPLIWKDQPFRCLLYIVIIQLWHKLNLIGPHMRLHNSSSEWAYLIIKLMLTGCCRRCQGHKNPRQNSLDFGGLLYSVQHMDFIIYMNCTINPGLYYNGVIDWHARHHISSAQSSTSAIYPLQLAAVICDLLNLLLVYTVGWAYRH